MCAAKSVDMADEHGARTGELAWIVEDKNLNHALDTAMKFAQNLSVVTGAAFACR
jgi:hypothetical protein